MKERNRQFFLMTVLKHFTNSVHEETVILVTYIQNKYRQLSDTEDITFKAQQLISHNACSSTKSLAKICIQQHWYGLS